MCDRKRGGFITARNFNEIHECVNVDDSNRWRLESILIQHTLFSLPVFNFSIRLRPFMDFLTQRYFSFVLKTKIECLFTPNNI